MVLAGLTKVLGQLGQSLTGFLEPGRFLDLSGPSRTLHSNSTARRLPRRVHSGAAQGSVATRLLLPTRRRRAARLAARLLRWCLQRGMAAKNLIHRSETSWTREIFDFEISEQDMADLDAVDRPGGTASPWSAVGGDGSGVKSSRTMVVRPPVCAGLYARRGFESRPAPPEAPSGAAVLLELSTGRVGLVT
jgi:hypothetical protein